MSCKQTQGRRLIAMLKRRGMTTMDMLRTEISVSPWRRITESLKEDERLVKAKNKRGLTVYRVRG
ncbi:hypothetical protein [Methylibium sp. T29]|uniref:hypothetical protein n=1 Tax=Methylibium sp. T29 TaxID=1430884 RepID=UPI0003F42524|nr:hypothetical protein [Methylibium sp. T29]EWS53311.1 hypothetical protein X551_03884 [Methylibium sp. T29]